MSDARAWLNKTLGCVGVVVPSVGLTKVWKILFSCFWHKSWLSLIGKMGDAGCV